MAQTVTRELKLALIVGFALVLVVTVLISDHLSQARTTRFGEASDARAEAVGRPEDVVLSMTRTPTPPGPLMEVAPMPGDPAAQQYPDSGALVVRDPSSVSPIPGAAAGAQPATLVQGAGGTLPVAMDTSVQPLPNADGAGAAPAPGQAMQPGVEAPVPAQPPGVIANVPPGFVPVPAPQESPQGGVRRGPIDEPLTRPAPAEESVATYTVAEGDSLYKIARKVYGSGERWRQLADANAQVIGKDHSVRPGMKLRLPERPVVKASPARPGRQAEGDVPQRRAERGNPVIGTLVQPAEPPAARPAAPKAPARKGSSPATYRVEKGDTLNAIAQKMLGSVRRADDILSLNESIDPDNLQVGDELRLPPR